MNLENIREHFPSLHRTHNKNSIIYLDGPAGTQVPTEVIEAISTYYQTSNANTHGQFLASQETDSMILDPHKGLFQSYGLGIVLVKSGESLQNAFTEHADYMRDGELN